MSDQTRAGRMAGKPRQLGHALRAEYQEVAALALELTPAEVMSSWCRIRDKAMLRTEQGLDRNELAGTSALIRIASDAQAQIDNIEDRKRRDAVWGEGGLVGEIRLYHTAPPRDDDGDTDAPAPE